ncbi:MAG TPA: hypothetical protein VH352_22720 [Pseudonocardiaceae bacterium]|nr:hypothetical protein [Pseudonocardiaceae bacterium]
MTTEDKVLLGVITGGAVGVPMLLGVTLNWSAWLWGALILVLLLIPLRVYRSISIRRIEQHEIRQVALAKQQERAELDKAAAPAQPQFQRAAVVDVSLPSALDGYDFLFSATVYWRPVPNPNSWPHANPAALAVDAIVARAQEVAVLEPPHRFAMAQVRLDSALGTIFCDRSGCVEAWATQVQLTLSDADLARLRAVLDVRKDAEVWQRERDLERDKRAYLGDDVLKTPGSAVVWWLARQENAIDVQGTVDLIGAFAQLSAVANDTPVPEQYRPPSSTDIADGPTDTTTAERVRELMDTAGMNLPVRALFVRRLAKLLAVAGRPEAANEIRQAFDPAPPVAGGLAFNGVAELTAGRVDDPYRDGAGLFARPDQSGVDGQ